MTSPSRVEGTWFSIFMASRMQITSPGPHLLALLDEDLHDRALHRREDLAVDVLTVMRVGGHRGPRGAASRRSSKIRTGIRRPSTSTRMSAGRWAAGPEDAKSGCAGRSASASARSSQVVVCVPARNSFVSRTHRWTGIVVGTPSTSNSSSAAEHPRASLLAVLAPHHQLGEHRVVVAGDLAARLDAGVHAHERAGGLPVAGDAAGPGEEVPARVLGVDPALDRGAARSGVQRQLLADGHADLERDQVEPVTISVTVCSTWRRVFISRK